MVKTQIYLNNEQTINAPRPTVFNYMDEHNYNRLMCQKCSTRTALATLYIPVSAIDPQLQEKYKGKVSIHYVSAVDTTTFQSNQQQYNDQVSLFVHNYCSRFDESQLQIKLIEMGSAQVLAKTLIAMIDTIQQLAAEVEKERETHQVIGSKGMHFVFIPWLIHCFYRCNKTEEKFYGLMNNDNFMMFAPAGNVLENVEQRMLYPISIPHNFEQMVVVGRISYQSCAITSGYSLHQPIVNLYVQSDHHSTAIITSRVVETAIAKYLNMKDKNKAKQDIVNSFQKSKTPSCYYSVMVYNNFEQVLNEDSPTQFQNK